MFQIFFSALTVEFFLFLGIRRMISFFCFLFNKKKDLLKKDLNQKKITLNEMDPRNHFAKWAKLKREITKMENEVSIQTRRCFYIDKLFYFISFLVSFYYFFFGKKNVLNISFVNSTSSLCIGSFIWYVICRKEIKRVFLTFIK